MHIILKKKKLNNFPNSNGMQDLELDNKAGCSTEG